MSDLETAQDKASWTVKAMPLDARQKAMACAIKQGQTAAEWLVRAIEAQANIEAGERILPPLVPVQPAGVAGAAMTKLEAVRAMADVAGAIAVATGRPPPRTVARHLYAMLDGECRSARGLLSPAAGQPPLIDQRPG